MSTQAPSASTHPITLTRALMMALVSIWSIALGVLALWFAFDPSSPIQSPLTRIAITLAILSAAQLLFLVCVAERLFTQTPRHLITRVRTVLALTLTIALLGAIVSIVVGTTP